MSRKDREHWLDGVSLSPGQYTSPYNALKRRQYIELGEGQTGLYRGAFEAAQIDRSATLVDIGCGDGHDLLELAIGGHTGKLVGVEVPYQAGDVDTFENRFLAVQMEIERLGINNIEFRQGYAEDIPIGDGEADAIVYGSVLQHPLNPEYVLKVETKRALRNRGKVIVIHNTPVNKPLHHQYIGEMGVQLESRLTPAPISSKFSITRASKEARLHYRIWNEYTRESKIPITAHTLPLLLASLDTYRDLYWPAVSPEDWLRARKDVVETPLEEKLSAGETINDTASRKVLILEKRLTTYQVAHKLGFDALGRSGFARQRP